MQRHQVWRLVFSSSATVYGGDAPVPMHEELPVSAANPYGWSKAMNEQVLRDVALTDAELADRRAALLQSLRRSSFGSDR